MINTPSPDAALLPAPVMRFIMHFGEMGSRWGINRTVGQIYALLYISPKPLCAEEMMGALGFSRSNISMGIKELDSLRLIRLVHLSGDRRDYFTTPEDIWEIVRTLVEERRKREIDPTLSILRDLLLDAPASEYEQHAHKKMQEMHDLISMLTEWYNDMREVDTQRLIALLKLGRKVFKFFEFTDRLKVIVGGRGDNKPEEG